MTDTDECPEWCVSTDHLEFRLNHKMDDYCHIGRSIECPTADLTHNWDPCHVEVYVSQQMHLVGNLRYVPMPGEVVIGDSISLSPDHARQLAGVLMGLADEADGLT